MKDRRIGKFYIDYSDVVSGKVRPVLAKMSFIPLRRVEMLEERRQFECVGISPLFDNCEMGKTTPIYDIIVNDLDSDVSVSVRKEE
jgi:hypothetical protein